MSIQELYTLPLVGVPATAKQLTFVSVSPAKFVMGGNDASTIGASDDFSDAPFETELTAGYWISLYPVTQAQWLSVFPVNPSHFQGSDLPVESVSWHEARFFCKQLTAKHIDILPHGASIDLPTEAQWELACSAGSRALLPEAKFKEMLFDQAWFAENSCGTTHVVGTKQPNTWGLFDMIGNVLEWCRDGAENYPDGRVPNWEGMNAFNKIVRGGSWSTHYPSELLTPFGRGYLECGSDSKFCGFRVVIHFP